MPDDCDARIDIGNFSPNGHITFRVETTSCLDSSGNFDYEYEYIDYSGNTRRNTRSNYWTRTNGQSSFTVTDDINLSSDETLDRVEIIASSIDCRCYDSSDRSEDNKDDSSDGSADLPRGRGPSEYDRVVTNDFVDLRAEMKSRITVERLLELFRWRVKSYEIESIAIVGGTAEYAAVPSPGLKTYTERSSTKIINDTGQRRTFDQTITLDTTIGVSANLTTTLVNSGDYSVGIDAKGLTGSSSQRYSLSVTKNETNNWTTTKRIEDRRNYEVEPNKMLVVDLAVDKRLDGLEFDALVISDGVVYVQHGSENVTIEKRWSFAEVWPNEADRTVRLKGVMYNVEVTNTTLTFKESDIEQTYQRRQNRLFGGSLQAYYSNGAPCDLRTLRKEMPQLWRELITAAQKLRVNEKTGKLVPTVVICDKSSSNDENVSPTGESASQTPLHNARARGPTGTMAAASTKKATEEDGVALQSAGSRLKPKPGPSFV